MIDPRWEEGGADFIGGYEYRVNGKIYGIPVGDIIHFRNGVDPASQGRKGLSDFAAVLREVCSDNEAAVFGAALMRNMGVPGVIISPKQETMLSTAARKKMVEDWTEKFTGERRGEPFVQSIPIDITMPGFSPQQMVLDKIRKIPEERITAAFGIPAVVLGMGAGLEASTAKASHSDARSQAYESCVIPTLYTFARAMTRALMPEFGDIATQRIWFDLTGVSALKADQDALYKRLDMAYNGGWLKRSEVREAAGYKSGPEDDVYAEKPSPSLMLHDGSGNPRARPKGTDANDGDPEEELKTIRAEIAARWAKATKEAA